MKKMPIFALSIGLFAAAGWTMEGNELQSSTRKDGVFIYKPTSDASKYIFFFVHGFNAKPKLLEMAIKPLVAKGYECHLLPLSGHRQDKSVMDFKSWQKDVNNSLDTSADQADEEKKKLIVVGHSLGGALLAHEIINKNPGIIDSIKLMVLLAPASGLRNIGEILSPFAKQLGTNEELSQKSNQEIKQYLPLLKMFQGLMGGKIPQIGKMICGKNAYTDDLSVESLESLLEANESTCSNLFRQNVNKVDLQKKMSILVIVNVNDGLVSHNKLTDMFGEHVIKLDLTTDPILAHTFQDEEHINIVINQIFKHL